MHIELLNLEGKTPPGKPRSRWQDNMKLHLREIEWGRMDWIDLTQDKDQWGLL
jgi:hypothetical protein